MGLVVVAAVYGLVGLWVTGRGYGYLVQQQHPRNDGISVLRLGTHVVLWPVWVLGVFAIVLFKWSNREELMWKG